MPHLATGSAELTALAQRIRLAIFDIDGVLSDGQLYLLPDGSDIKTSNVRDGLGLKLLMQAGVEVAVISGRPSSAYQARLAALGVQRVNLAVKQKIPHYESLLVDLGCTDAEVAYMGDDLPDVPVMQRVGLPMAVANAHASALNVARWVSRLPGGHGAAREACDLILAARDSAAAAAQTAPDAYN